AERLKEGLRLLTGGSRTALPRHQTLRATMDWSYALLTPEEQALLRRLSVFAGGFSLEAAEAVCFAETEDEVLGLLASLVDKSLVVYEADSRNGRGRYRLLETVGQYAREKLGEQGEEEALRRRHRDYFLSLAEETEPKLYSPEQGEWFARLEMEHDNL